MKKNLFCLMLAASLLVAAPANATLQGSQVISLKPGSGAALSKSPNEVFLPMAVRFGTTGERLNIFFSGTQYYPPGSPFHIAHGWMEDPTDEHFECFTFELQVDGVYRGENFIEVSPYEAEPAFQIRNFIFNFPAGMSGVHTFAGHWLGPCSAFYEDCTDPDEIVENRTSVVQVTFVP